MSILAKTRPFNSDNTQARAAKDGRLTLIVEPILPSRGSCILGGPSKRPIDWQKADYFKKFCNDSGETDWWSAMSGDPYGSAAKRGCISHLKAPLGIKGDFLWAREGAWIDSESRTVDYTATMDADAVRCANEYGATRIAAGDMPFWASRFHFVVECVRVLRLNDLTEAEAMACGYRNFENKPAPLEWQKMGHETVSFARLAKAGLIKDWDHKYGKCGKNEALLSKNNPWIWAYTVSQKAKGNDTPLSWFEDGPFDGDEEWDRIRFDFLRDREDGKTTIDEYAPRFPKYDLALRQFVRELDDIEEGANRLEDEAIAAGRDPNAVSQSTVRAFKRAMQRIGVSKEIIDEGVASFIVEDAEECKANVI